ncbi:TPA: LPS export ABC transporter periplasmic protein LptC [Candidatus Galligastranaerophilus intestinigallinarum]|nr:LPS export ABC transporter periplasmic protein LptC [Candidatus Galligastranaerophilus intestinigallinarum]
MLNKKKIYIILFSLIVLICLSGFIWSFVVTKDIRNSQKTEKGTEKNQVVSVKNLVLTETKDEEIYWELYAVKGSYDSSKGTVILDNATGNFYNTDNEVVLSFESDLGTYNEETKQITLRGNTLVVAHDGSSIRADEIIFKGKGEDIIAKGNVVVSRNEDFVSYANQARFNSELTFFEISGKTQTNVYSEDEVKPQELTN